MKSNQKPKAVPGWKGGFSTSKPEFSYPTPNLDSLCMLKNMDNIDQLRRQQAVKWPEFSWESEPGDPKSRCFQMFAPDISRIGYTNEGRVFSIICPQQGVCSPSLGCMNVEVTVTGQRGWVNEDTRELAADMTVTGQIWFSPSLLKKSNTLTTLLWNRLEKLSLPFPFDKAHAIQVQTGRMGGAPGSIFPVVKGESDRFKSPDFARHPDEAWTVGHIEVQIGPIKPSSPDSEIVDEFNKLVMGIFNLASGNMLKQDNVLSWNVWFYAPRYVNQTEWRTHAERWRDSIDADHGSPDGPGTSARYFDGSPLKPIENLAEYELEAIWKFIKTHL